MVSAGCERPGLSEGCVCVCVGNSVGRALRGGSAVGSPSRVLSGQLEGPAGSDRRSERASGPEARQSYGEEERRFTHILPHRFMKPADVISEELNAQRRSFTPPLWIAAITDALITRHHVLPPVVTACSPHPKASQPSLVVQSLNVHGLLPAEFPVGAETLHNLCLGLLGRFVPHLLQLLGELFLVSLLWLPAA